MNTRTVFATLVLLVALPGCAPDNVKTGLSISKIAEVSTIAELKAVSPILLAKGWEIRLGVSDAGPDGGPWKLLYCLERHTEDTDAYESHSRGVKETELSTKPLGPVRFSVDDPGSPPKQRYGSLASQVRMIAGDAVFCALIPIAWKGDYRIRVYANDGRVLEQRILRIDENHTSYWMPFVAEYDITDDPEEEHDIQSPAEVLDNEGTSSHPNIRGTCCIWRGASESADIDREPLPGRLPGPRAGPLFGLPEEEGPASSSSLKLSVDGNILRIDAPAPVLRSSLARHLLARWWLNGQPVAAHLARDESRRKYSRSSQFVASFQLGLSVPGCVHASTGDRVGLQIVYCPAGYSPLPSRRRAVDAISQSLQAAPDLYPWQKVPLLSDRIEFTVTQDMLKRTSHASTERKP